MCVLCLYGGCGCGFGSGDRCAFGCGRLMHSALDFNAVAALVDATHRYKEIFYRAD